ncbi:active regulator of SIRT1 isoform X1 [Manis javanica]|uniref:active regulator of SIRT1 isoform X1 n=1 Tax=Manis javanica TaxID=9974 RepID=UPI001879B1EC|nr:active regulator of SIRT1 isoform X1 [Manis javanica]
MSAALLRRGLELLGATEGEGTFPGRPSAGWSAAGAVGRSPKAPRAAPGQAKPSGAPVKRNRKAKATQAQKLRNSAKGKVPKSALAEFQKRECRSYLGENLKFMTSTRRKVAESVTQQIVRQNQGRKACDRPVTKTKKKKAEGTVFTEEDFQKFQQEYFGS